VTPAKPPATEPIDAVYTVGEGSGHGQWRFALRSLARYAPWIRKVHLVTAGTPPAWVKGTFPRLAIVPAGELPGRGALDWRMFRIPGLSRRFLHLDAACFLGQPLAADDFVTPKAGYRFFVEDADIPAGDAAGNLLNARFGNRGPRKQLADVPQLLDKSFLEEVHRLWEVQIQRTPEVSLATLYHYYLLESPLQYGIHERVALDAQSWRAVTLAGVGDAFRVPGILREGRRFVNLRVAAPEGQGGACALAMRLLLRMSYWRKSPFEAR
jgi:hypothetical protein